MERIFRPCNKGEAQNKDLNKELYKWKENLEAREPLNIIHNPTLATITEAQVLLEPRVQTLLLKYSLQYDTSQKARPQAQAMSLSLKFRYTRKLLHLPRCRGIVLPLMLQEILVLNCPRTSNCSLGCSVATPKPTHTHEHNYAWSRLGGRGKKKSIFSDVSTQRK